MPLLSNCYVLWAACSAHYDPAGSAPPLVFRLSYSFLANMLSVQNNSKSHGTRAFFFISSSTHFSGLGQPPPGKSFCGTLPAVSPKTADNRKLPAYRLPSPAVPSPWWPWFQEWALQPLPIAAFVQPLTPVLDIGLCPVFSYHP
jgi:hypothetical protein